MLQSGDAIGDLRREFPSRNTATIFVFHTSSAYQDTDALFGFCCNSPLESVTLTDAAALKDTLVRREQENIAFALRCCCQCFLDAGSKSVLEHSREHSLDKLSCHILVNLPYFVLALTLNFHRRIIY